MFGIAAFLVLVYGVLYLFSTERVTVSAAASPGDDSEVKLIAARGEAVEVTDHLVPGKFTVVDFYADWCPSCRTLSPYLERVARARDEVVLRKVNVVNWSTPVVAKYRVTALPYLQMYDPGGKLIADGADQVLAEMRRRF